MLKSGLIKKITSVTSLFIFAATLSACGKKIDEPTLGANLNQVNAGQALASNRPSQRSVTTSSIQELFAKSGLSKQFAGNFADMIWFPVDQSSLTNEAREALDKQSLWLQAHPNHSLSIAGHADERGTRSYNLGLSARRATAVRTYLAASGVDATRIKVLSYGKERPLVTCTGNECWSRNRRAQTKLTN